MRTIALSIAVLISLTMLSMASEPFSAISKIELSRHSKSNDLRCLSVDYQSFISFRDTSVITSLRHHGAKINGIYDGFVSATIPAALLKSVGTIKGISHISIARPLSVCNDSARYLCNVDPLHNAADYISPITGCGVIVGVIDIGVDFNHINLCDVHGVSRVRAVYMPVDTSGTSSIIDMDTLPGSCYESPELIAALTTDYQGSSHGTHTTGSAAGGYRGNGWHGVAPDADIVVCAMPSDELTDFNIANSLKYIFDYADRSGKPCVVNMSIGTNDGPNDGSSYLCRVFNSITGPGRICVLSAGNDGSFPVRFHKELQGHSDTVTTLLRNRWSSSQRNGYVSMWSNREQEHRSRLVVINRNTAAIEYASPIVGTLPEDSVFTLDSEMDSEFARFFDGEIIFANALEPRFGHDGITVESNRYHSYWMFEATLLDASHVFGFQYVSDEPVELVGWCTNNDYFYTFGLDGITGGSSEGSISDLATSDSVISVGAYCSRRSYINKQGNQYTYYNSHPYDIADFSSYGPDENGIARPDICAPGLAVISSANRYATSNDQWPESAWVNGIEYPYYGNQGTSMSAPMVTGTVALMLQINPTLSPGDVRKILAETATRDDYVLYGDRNRWGAGKLNTKSAVEQVVNSTLVAGDVNIDREVNIADVNLLIEMILSGLSDYHFTSLMNADVNHDREIGISDINCLIDLILNNF